MILYKWQRLNWARLLCRCGIEDWQLWAVHCIHHTRISNKL